MARALRWFGICAFLSVPVLLMLGRPRASCNPAPCMDPNVTGWPGWVVPALIGVVMLGLVLLLASAVVGLDED